MSLTAMIFLESARRKFFINSTSSCLDSGSQTYLDSGFRNESNSHDLAPIGVTKIFHELDVHHL